MKKEARQSKWAEKSKKQEETYELQKQEHIEKLEKLVEDAKKPDSEIHEHRKRYLTCERKGVFLLLILAAGMMGAYTYNLRGGVFCNAQTANIVLMAMALGRGEWMQALYFLIPISAYVAGAFVSEVLPSPVKRFRLLRWDTFLVGMEIIVLFAIGWIPLTVPHHVVQVMINFICSMQYNTFRQAEGIPMATTFCTNHVRQIGISLAKYVRHRDRAAISKGRMHFMMILSFICGGVALTVICGLLKEKAIWLAMVPLLVDFIILAHADISQERGRLYDIPAGH